MNMKTFTADERMHINVIMIVVSMFYITYLWVFKLGV